MPDCTPAPPQPDVLDMWTVYEHPSDYPGEYVARRFVVAMGRYTPTLDVVRADTLDGLQVQLSATGRTWMPRMDADEAQVVGVWL